MQESALIRLFFSIALAVYAFSLVVFDNALYLNLVYVTGILLSGSYVVYVLLARVKPQMPPALWAFAGLLAFSVLSVFWSIDQGYSLDKARTLALILINMVVVYNVIVKFRNVVWLFGGLYMAMLVNFLMALGMLDIGLEQYGVRFLGTLNQSNLMGYATHVTVFCAYVQMLSVPARQARTGNKMIEIFLLILVALIAVFLTFITGSRAAIVLLAVLLMWMVMSSVFRPTTALPLIAVLIVGGLGFKGMNTAQLVLSGERDLFQVIEVVIGRLQSGAEDNDASRDERERLAKAAYAMFEQNPLLGNGLGAFEFAENASAHNNYMEVLSSVGVIGLLFMLGFYGLMLKEILLLNTWRMRLLFGLMLSSLLLYDVAQVSLTGKFHMMMATVFLACVVVLRSNRDRSVNPIVDVYEGYRDANPRKRRRRRRVGQAVRKSL